MIPTVDMTRRKSAMTLDAVLRHQLRKLRETGSRDCRVILRPDQAEEIYKLLHYQVQPPGSHLRVAPGVKWNGVHLHVRGAK